MKYNTAAIVAILTFTLLLNSCEDDSQVVTTIAEREYIHVDGYQIPTFNTPEEQLNYTRSWFADIEEKKAALQAFIKIFATEKEMGGEAALDLAYLALGEDHRFSNDYECFAAIAAYTKILEKYNEYPTVMAKSYWYIGWVYTELIGDVYKGIESFEKVIKDFSDVPLVRSSPVPWVSIIYPDNTLKTSLYKPPNNSWAAMALVEIIKHSPENRKAWNAFSHLWEKYTDTVAAGFGLKFMLKRKYQSEQLVPIARDYMEKNFSNVHILSDIQKEINLLEGITKGSEQ